MMKLILFGIGLFIGLVILAQRLWWWFGRSYFLGYRICNEVCTKKLPEWWQKAVNLLFYKPHNLTTWGFITTLVWPSFLVLNLCLVAQILERFLPGGEIIKIPYIGNYASLSLIAGVLFAIGQTFFLTFYEEPKSEKEKKGRLGSHWIVVIGHWLRKHWLLVLFIVTIIIEIGLSGYRAWLFSVDKEKITPNLLDQLMGRGGIGLAALLGFIVPMAESLIGARSLANFIVPMLAAPLYWIGGAIVLIWCVITWLVSGFYPVAADKHPPRLNPPDFSNSIIGKWLEAIIEKIKTPGIKVPESVKNLEIDVNNLLMTTTTIEGQLRDSKKGLTEIGDYDKLKEGIDNLNSETQSKIMNIRTGLVFRLLGEAEIEDWNKRKDSLFKQMLQSQGISQIGCDEKLKQIKQEMQDDVETAAWNEEKELLSQGISQGKLGQLKRKRQALQDTKKEYNGFSNRNKSIYSLLEERTNRILGLQQTKDQFEYAKKTYESLWQQYTALERDGIVPDGAKEIIKHRLNTIKAELDKMEGDFREIDNKMSVLIGNHPSLERTLRAIANASDGIRCDLEDLLKECSLKRWVLNWVLIRLRIQQGLVPERRDN